MVKPEWICFGNVLGLLWEANSRRIPEDLRSKVLPIPL